MLFDPGRDLARRTHRVLGIGLDIGDTLVLVIKHGLTVANAVLLNVVMRGLKSPEEHRVYRRIVLLKKTESEKLEKRALGLRLGLDQVIVRVCVLTYGESKVRNFDPRDVLAYLSRIRQGF